MVGDISTTTRTEVLGSIRNRYAEASKRDRSRMLDGVRGPNGLSPKARRQAYGAVRRGGRPQPPRGKRIYDDAVRQALVVVWEAADRICGKRLKAALPSMVESLERHGHLDLDPDVREGLFSASASTIDRLLRPVREKEEVGESCPSTHLHGLERARARLSRDRPSGTWRWYRDRSLHPQLGGHRRQLGMDRGCAASGTRAVTCGRGTQSYLRRIPCAGPRHRLRQRQRVHQRDTGLSRAERS